MQKVVFEPFRQVETGLSRNYGGTGLGLAIVKGYVQMLNGTITMESKNNAGTIFTISIPVQQIRDRGNNMKNKQLSDFMINNLLIVEDEPGNFEYLKELLTDYSPHILYAPDGQTALDICKDNNQIDLVLMDIQMPFMDGHTATKLIKAFRPDLAIIAQTAYATERDVENFLESGFDGYVCKPIEMEMLFSTIDKVINDR
jgi:CheY-like chemotaxis protein